MFPRFIPAYPNRTYVVVNRLRVITKLINIPCYYWLIKSPLGYVLTDIFQFPVFLIRVLDNRSLHFQNAILYIVIVNALPRHDYDFFLYDYITCI